MISKLSWLMPKFIGEINNNFHTKFRVIDNQLIHSYEALNRRLFRL